MENMPHFITDKQTLDDLNLLGRYRPDSVYNLFNQVHTAGGARLLESMFHHPLTDINEINKRSELFRYYEQQGLIFPFDKPSFEVMENYLSNSGENNQLMTGINVLKKKIKGDILKDEVYQIELTGLLTTIELLNTFSDFMNDLVDVQEVKNIFADKRLSWLGAERGVKELSLLKVIKYNYLLRSVLQEEMNVILEMIYHVDVCIAVTDVSRAKGFTYAYALPASANIFQVTDLRHPCLQKAIGNPLKFHEDNNVLFLTGANMAGKSTFMKAYGIVMYLAHMGFPVAAAWLEFSVKEGMYSSINVPDNLSLGYSHFYAEVLRVKSVAEAVSSGKNLVVIFDELFKGTNVKDAYDATLAVTEAFSQYRNCFFIISTHIIEVGETLRERCDNFRFAYLPTVMEGVVPKYTYRMEEGITTDRHGMMIIENEGILDIL
jgi:DNA mismatch repair protein MutS